jgi:hypothetical protein
MDAMGRTAVWCALAEAAVGALSTAVFLRSASRSGVVSPPIAPIGVAPRSERTSIAPSSQRVVQEHLRAGWASVRDDPMPLQLVERALTDFYEQTRRLPHEIASSLAKRETNRDEWKAKVATDGLVAVLGGLQHRKPDNRIGPLPSFVGDASTFDEHFVRQTPEKVVHHDEEASVSAHLVDGTTLRYPKGVFRLWRYVPDTSPIADDMSIEGAGMDETLLVVDNTRVGNRLVRFRLADCTVLSWGPALVKLNQSASVMLERVRFVGFDDAPASGDALSFHNSIALLARECRFEGGYGDSTMTASLVFAPTASILARFETCRFDRLRFLPRQVNNQATIVFDGCMFTDLLTDPSPAIARHEGLVLNDTSLELYDWAAGPPPARSLEDLFPGWREGGSG